MAAEIGAAPDFSLYQQAQKALIGLQRPERSFVVLLAFTFVCTGGFVRDSLRIYEELNVQPLGITVDSLYSLAPV